MTSQRRRRKISHDWDKPFLWINPSVIGDQSWSKELKEQLYKMVNIIPDPEMPTDYAYLIQARELARILQSMQLDSFTLNSLKLLLEQEVEMSDNS